MTSRGYSASLLELRERKPDLWLPAIATNDQNANLYERDWARIIEDNLMVTNFILSSGQKPVSARFGMRANTRLGEGLALPEHERSLTGQHDGR